MTPRHKLIALDDALPDMVLGEAVLDERGMVLLPPDTTLTETMLRSLSRRGIEQICIVDASLSQAELEAELARQRLRLAVLFRKYPQPLDHGGDLLLASIRSYRIGDGP